MQTSTLFTQSHRGAHKDRVRAFAYVPNLSALASASRDGTLKLWNEHAFSFSKPELGKSLLGTFF